MNVRTSLFQPLDKVIIIKREGNLGNLNSFWSTDGLIDWVGKWCAHRLVQLFLLFLFLLLLFQKEFAQGTLFCFLFILLSIVIVSHIWHLRQSIFKLFLDVLSELGDLAHRARLIEVNLFEILITLLWHIKLDCVVTGCDRVNIKINEHVSLNGADVIKVQNSVTVYNHSNASQEQASNLSLLHSLKWNLTSHLNEKVTIFIAFFL